MFDIFKKKMIKSNCRVAEKRKTRLLVLRFFWQKGGIIMSNVKLWNKNFIFIIIINFLVFLNHLVDYILQSWR